MSVGLTKSAGEAPGAGEPRPDNGGDGKAVCVLRPVPEVPTAALTRLPATPLQPLESVSPGALITFPFL